MSKKIKALLLIPFSVLGIEICTPNYWDDVEHYEVDSGIFLEDLSTAMVNPEYETFRHNGDGCLRRQEDTSGVHAVCFDNMKNLPYCYYRGNSLLHLAAQFSNDIAVIDALVSMGLDLYAINDDGVSVESYSMFNSANNIFDGVFFTVSQDVGDDDDDLSIGDDLMLDYEQIEINTLPPIPPPERRTAPRYSQRDLSLDYGLDGENKKNGLYLNFNIGITGDQTLEMNSSDNDIPAKCTDPFRTGITAVEQYYFCKQGQNSWDNSFKGQGDIAMGTAVGIKHNNLRIEAEGSVRQIDSIASDITFQTDRSIEYSDANESIGIVDVKTQFANVYIDFDEFEKVRPFVGVGGGRILQRYKYNAYFLRTSDEAVLELFDRGEHTAGKSTRADQIFTNSTWGTQFIGGFNIPMNDYGDLTIKARYLRIPDVVNMSEWDILRNSHFSQLPVLNDPVQYEQELRGRGLFDITLGFTIYLGRK